MKKLTDEQLIEIKEKKLKCKGCGKEIKYTFNGLCEKCSPF